MTSTTPVADQTDPMLQRMGTWTEPAALGALGAGAVALLAVVDPNESGIYPACPSLTVFGVLCPLCGGLRGMHALTQGDLVGMISSNVFVPLVVVLGVWAWLSWMLATVGGPRLRAPVLSQRTWVVVGVIAVLYTVLRNLAGTPFEILAP